MSTMADEQRSQPRPTMVELARQILADAEKLESYMNENNLTIPTLAVDGADDYPGLPPDILKHRHAVIFGAQGIQRMAHGPREIVRWEPWKAFDSTALAVLNHYSIAKLFAPNESITLAELQTKTSLDPVNLARCLRTCISNGIFLEPSPGIIAHTAASRLLAEDEELQAWVGFNCEDIGPAAAHVLDALKHHPEANHLARSGFCYANGTVDVEPMFVTLGRDANRAKRMSRAMTSLSTGEGYEVKYLVDVASGGYDFSDVDAAAGVFVDLGGSHGFVPVELAKRYHNMRFVVQDLPKMVQSVPQPIHPDPKIASRITFQAHDFFTEQPVKGADVIFLRWIAHNYSNQYAIKILKNLVPALKPGSRILINDHCLLEPGQDDPWDDRVMRRMDMVMLSLLNSQERTEAEFRALFKQASDGFVFKGVSRAKGCRMSVIEAVWQPRNPN